MKTKPSHYVLAVEILTIVLLHAVKIKNAEKHPSDIVYMPGGKTVPQQKPVVENKNSIEYMLVNLVK
jgi:hypothetical protein